MNTPRRHHTVYTRRTSNIPKTPQRFSRGPTIERPCILQIMSGGPECRKRDLVQLPMRPGTTHPTRLAQGERVLANGCEYGPCNDCFSRWLDEYCDLQSIRLTSAELWELRNSMIHMTNLESRKVRSGKTAQLLPRITHPDRELPEYFDGMKVFHVSRFLLVFCHIKILG